MKTVYLITAALAFAPLGAIANPVAHDGGIALTATSKVIDLKVGNMK